MRNMRMFLTGIAAAALSAAMLTACAGNGGTEAANTSAAETSEANPSSETSETETSKTEISEAETSKAETSPPETSAEETPAPGISGSETSAAALHPFLSTHYESEYDSEGHLLVQVEYQQVGLYDEEGSYQALQSALEQHWAEREAALQEKKKELAEMAAAGVAAAGETVQAYENLCRVRILRADPQVFSFAEDLYVYSGGAHGISQRIGVTLDTRTGEILELSGVVSDREALAEYVIDSLEEQYGSQDLLFEGWKDTVWNEIHEVSYAEAWGLDVDGASMRLAFALSPSAMEVYFAPYEIGPYAMGTITVEVPYDAPEAGFREGYLPQEERSVWNMEAGEPLSMDLDRDGTEETISFAVSEGKEGQYFCTLQIAGAEGETASASGECGYGVTAAYLMRTPEGKSMFYGECRSDNDWRYLMLFDLTEIWKSRADGETPEAAQYYEAFYDNVPVSSESFCLGTRGSLLSTVGLHREHRTGENGLPEAVSDVFWFDDFTLTAKADIPGTAADGTRTAIPAGTRIRAVSTDEASWVVFEPEHGGEPVKVEIDGADWPHTIQGEDMEMYLEGLIFAG